MDLRSQYARQNPLIRGPNLLVLKLLQFILQLFLELEELFTLAVGQDLAVSLSCLYSVVVTAGASLVGVQHKSSLESHEHHLELREER